MAPALAAVIAVACVGVGVGTGFGVASAQQPVTPLILVPDTGGPDYELVRRQVDALPGESNNARNRLVITDDEAFARLATLAKTTGLPGRERFSMAFFNDIVCTLSSIRAVGSGPRSDPGLPFVGYEQFAAGCEEFDQPGDELTVFVHPESGDVVLSLTLDSNVLAIGATTLHSQYSVGPIAGTIYSRSAEFDINAMLAGRVLEPVWE